MIWKWSAAKLQTILTEEIIIYDSIRKIETGPGDDYTTGCLLEYNYFKNYYKMITIDLSKQKALDTDPKAIQQINLTRNSEREGNANICFSLLKKQKKLF